MERKLRLREEYHKFLKEYEDLHFLKSNIRFRSKKRDFLSTASMAKSTSITTKLRIVFDDSLRLVKINYRNIFELKIAKWTESAIELEEYHHPFQSTSICDVGIKMFRQIWVSAEDQSSTDHLKGMPLQRHYEYTL